MQVNSISSLDSTVLQLAEAQCPPAVGSVNAIKEKVFRESSLDFTVSGGSGNASGSAPTFMEMLRRERGDPEPRKPPFGSISHKGALKAADEVRCHEANAPYNGRKVDFGIERVAVDDPRMHLLSNNGTYGRPNSISGEIGYARMQMCTTPDDVYQWVSSILGNEKATNSTDRPSKIFLTIGAMAHDWKTPLGINHAVVIVIEPDSRNHDKARITIVNPVASEEHSEYEDAVLRGIQQVYHSRANRIVKNKKI